jgi:hypothetical protein
VLIQPDVIGGVPRAPLARATQGLSHRGVILSHNIASGPPNDAVVAPSKSTAVQVLPGAMAWPPPGVVMCESTKHHEASARGGGAALSHERKAPVLSVNQLSGTSRRRSSTSPSSLENERRQTPAARTTRPVQTRGPKPQSGCWRWAKVRADIRSSPTVPRRDQGRGSSDGSPSLKRWMASGSSRATRAAALEVVLADPGGSGRCLRWPGTRSPWFPGGTVLAHV